MFEISRNDERVLVYQCSPKFVRTCRTLGQTESDFLSDRTNFCLTGKIGDFPNTRSRPSRVGGGRGGGLSSERH